MSSSNTGSSLDHLPPSEQLCYVHCNLCNTVLAVSVPSSSLLKTVTVRCGHCTNLLPVNMRAILVPPPPTNHLQSANNHHFSPTSHNLHLGVSMSLAPNFPIAQPTGVANYVTASSSCGGHGITELPKPPTTNRPPEKRQRVPSAYNRFIKDEIQRIKVANPHISHREAFSAAAKNGFSFIDVELELTLTGENYKMTVGPLPAHPFWSDAGSDGEKDKQHAPSPPPGGWTGCSHEKWIFHCFSECWWCLPILINI